MSPSDRQDTVSLFSLWRDNRDGLRPFGEICRLARQGAIPGTVGVQKGTPVVLRDRTADALHAMRTDT